MAAVTEEHPIAKVEDTGHEDLLLSPEEKAQEAAEAAANRERGLGGSTEALDDVYGKTYAEVLASEQAKTTDPEPEAEQELPPESLTVTGTQEKPGKVDGKQPTEVYLVVKGVKIEVPDGSFKKGERMSFTGEMVVFERKDRDRLDPHTKTPTDCAQSFTCEVIDFKLDED